MLSRELKELAETPKQKKKSQFPPQNILRFLLAKRLKNQLTSNYCWKTESQFSAGLFF
jgi:hypothetical protein